MFTDSMFISFVVLANPQIIRTEYHKFSFFSTKVKIQTPNTKMRNNIYYSGIKTMISYKTILGFIIFNYKVTVFCTMLESNEELFFTT